MSKTVTREDVAKLANVSSTIVPYVPNNSNYVSQEKGERILEAVRQLSYIPNQLARRLKASRSTQFIFMYDNIQTRLFEAVEARLLGRGYYISLNCSRNTKEFLDVLINRQLGKIFMAANIFDAQQLNSIAINGVPIILYRIRHYGELGPRIVTVVPDYYDAVRKSVDYLILKGHTCIGIVPPVKYPTRGVEGDDFRVRAYVEALRRSSIPVRPELICTRTQTVDGIYEEVFHMLVSSEKDGRPTTLVVGNDYLAAQIMQYLKKLSISVPGDLSVIGCDSTQIAPPTTPALTIVNVSEEKLAKTYVDKMLIPVEGQQTEDKCISVKLIIRENA